MQHFPSLGCRPPHPRYSPDPAAAQVGVLLAKSIFDGRSADFRLAGSIFKFYLYTYTYTRILIHVYYTLILQVGGEHLQVPPRRRAHAARSGGLRLGGQHAGTTLNYFSAARVSHHLCPS